MTNRFQAGLQSQHNEIQVERLPTEGTIPAWLQGTLVRNGPAQFEFGQQSYRHWFDGLAMLHAFTFTGAGVSYANRFIPSKAHEHNNREGKITFGEFATDPCRSLFSRVMSVFTPPQYSGNTNINVTKLGDAFIAQTEYPMSVQFDPHTLDMLGVEDHAGLNGQITTAHPHYDFERRLSYNYALSIGREMFYRVYQHNGGYKLLTEIKTQQPAYMHSFGMSERYLILVEYPLRLPTPLALLLSGKPFIENYQWHPEDGTTFTVIDKDTSEIVTRATADPFFAFHHVNAFERDGELIVDICAYDDPAVIDNLYLDVLRNDAGFSPINATLRRYHVPLAGGQVTHAVVSPESFELPRINYRQHSGKTYRYAYGTGTRTGTQDFTNQLVKLDTETGTATSWFADGCYPGEPVFVRHPEGSAEDDGVILSVVLDSSAGTSFLLILDATHFNEIARAKVPQVVPFGFHGDFFRD